MHLQWHQDTTTWSIGHLDQMEAPQHQTLHSMHWVVCGWHWWVCHSRPSHIWETRNCPDELCNMLQEAITHPQHCSWKATDHKGSGPPEPWEATAYLQHSRFQEGISRLVWRNWEIPWEILYHSETRCKTRHSCSPEVSQCYEMACLCWTGTSWNYLEGGWAKQLGLLTCFCMETTWKALCVPRPQGPQQGNQTWPPQDPDHGRDHTQLQCHCIHQSRWHCLLLLCQPQWGMPTPHNF